jgi:hypothetical protein
VKIATWKVAPSIAGKSANGESFLSALSLARILEDHRSNPFMFQAPSRQKSPDLNLLQAHLMI